MIDGNNTARERVRRAESGQAIIFIALILIALAGMTGLAIDGGGLYFLHRDTQNAADAALLAATYALCTTNHDDVDLIRADVQEAAFLAASQNGFPHHDDLSTADVETWDQDTLISWVEVHYPPVSEPAASRLDALDFVEINVSAIKPTYFIQFVYAGQPLTVTSGGIAKCTPPRSNLLPPAGLVAIAQSLPGPGCTTLDFQGGSKLTVTNSGIYVNSSESPCDHGNVDGHTSATLICTADPIQVVAEGACENIITESCTSVSCGPAYQYPADPLGDIQAAPTLGCNGPKQAMSAGLTKVNDRGNSYEYAPGQTTTDHVYTLAPGHYNDIQDMGTNAVLVFQPGMYCTYEINFNNGEVYGEDVAFYIPSRDTTRFEEGEGMTGNGSTRVRLYAPDDDYCDDPVHRDEVLCDWEGLLLWSDAPGDPNKTVQINGSSNSTWEGLIYAPEQLCTINGTSGSSIVGQVLCHTVEYAGTEEMVITYESAAFLDTPPTIGVIR